jgi:NTP pyrophosphatase (non-canonical NTP hydrolase)
MLHSTKNPEAVASGFVVSFVEKDPYPRQPDSSLTPIIGLTGIVFMLGPILLSDGPKSNASKMNATDLTLRQFQRLISERYESTDRARGTPKTFLWFIEEVGELARALNGTDRTNLREEFADVFAWLCTLANINDIDLAEAVAEKYLKEDAKKEPK